MIWRVVKGGKKASFQNEHDAEHNQGDPVRRDRQEAGQAGQGAGAAGGGSSGIYSHSFTVAIFP